MLVLLERQLHRLLNKQLLKLRGISKTVCDTEKEVAVQRKMFLKV